MSFGRKIISAITLAFAMFTLTTFIAAQDTNQQTDRTDKKDKFERKGRGERGFGRGMRGEKRGGGERFIMREISRLDLTDAQKEQIRGVMEAAKTANEPIYQELRGFKEKNRSELTEADKARLTDIKTRMKQSAEQTRNTVLSILTAEQRQQLEQFKLERRKRMEERRQQWENRRDQQTPTAPKTNN